MLFIGRFSAFLFFHFAFPTQPGKNRYREKTVNTSAVNLKPFSLIVKPASADCNLRCSYCFYPEKCRHYPITAKHRRPEAVLENLIRGYLSTDQPVYTFGWQGGEPMLMGLDFFRRVTDFMCEIFDLWYYQDRRTVSVRYFDSLLQKRIDGSCNVCTLANNCCQYFAVEYNGDIYPCDFFVREDLKIGNIRDMSWENALTAPLYIDFGHQKSRCNPACMTCDCRELCMGDCLKNRFYGNSEALSTLSRSFC